MMQLRTKIVCTIGPASQDPIILRRLIRAGMDVARLNLSHGDRALHAENIRRIRDAAATEDQPVGILVDLQGPKLRIGSVVEGGILLAEGQEVLLTTRDIVGHDGEIPVQYKGLPDVVHPGERLLLDDGLIELRVLETKPTEIRCQVVTGGLLQSHKGLNLPQAGLIPAITDKDREDLRFAMDQGADWIALSFVRTADEVYELRQLQQGNSSGRLTPIIAKIEKAEAVKNIEAIIEAADGIMVARGDLGIETSPELVPMTQKDIIARCNAAGKPVITATQMLETMIHNPRPTRAEASDVANAILDGSDALMLSGETAVGRYPVEAVETMVKIGLQAERYCKAGLALASGSPHSELSVAQAVAHASCALAADLGAAAIIAPTLSGYTARNIARYRPCCPIIAVTPDPVVQRQLTLYWGVYPLLAERADNTDEVIHHSVSMARERGYVRSGDTVVVTAGSACSGPGSTDLIKVHVV